MVSVLATTRSQGTNLLPCALVNFFEVFFGDLRKEFTNVFFDFSALVGRSIVGVELKARGKTCNCSLKSRSGVEASVAYQLTVNLTVAQEVAGLVKDVGTEMITNAMYVVGKLLRIGRSSASRASLSVWLERELRLRKSAL